VEAIRRFLRELDRERPALRGRFVGVVGNRVALGQRKRYIDRDLNRGWTRANLRALVNKTRPSSEDIEQRELIATFRPHLARARRPVVFIDLHSTSGEGVPFSCAADVLRNRPLAMGLGVPWVLGLEEVIEGSMLGCLCDYGHVGVAIEGGPHDDPRTIEHHTAALWIQLALAGLLDAGHPAIGPHRQRLCSATSGTSAIVEVVHRHVVGPSEAFEMLPGFRSFDPVAKGQLLARSGGRPVTSPHDGLLLMPRYQALGEDGFFIVRPIRSIWLTASSALRRLGLDRALRYVPGVAAQDDEGRLLRVDGRPSIPPQLFHLLGYRRCPGDTWPATYIRRQPDSVDARPLPFDG
jgi:succinylglutamate desuccinylase